MAFVLRRGAETVASPQPRNTGPQPAQPISFVRGAGPTEERCSESSVTDCSARARAETRRVTWAGSLDVRSRMVCSWRG